MAEGLLAQIEQSQNTISTDASTFTVDFKSAWDTLDNTTIDPNPWIHNRNEDKKGFTLLTLGYFSPFVKPFIGTTIPWNTGDFTWTTTSTASTARWLDMGTGRSWPGNTGKVMSK